MALKTPRGFFNAKEEALRRPEMTSEFPGGPLTHGIVS